MPRFRFALSSADTVRQAGVLQVDSFSDALEAISEHVPAEEGDTLEIGVNGFPPARYEYVLSVQDGSPAWRPAGAKAA
jgi:hypothetical protein